MRPTQSLSSGGKWMGGWGNLGSMPQKGIVHYGLAQNRQNPLAGVGSSMIFNTFRRTRHQILYWSIPMLIGYESMQWAIERNEYLNSKPGRAEFAGQE